MPDEEEIQRVLTRLADKYDHEVEVGTGPMLVRALGRRDAINDVWQALGLPVREVRDE